MKLKKILFLLCAVFLLIFVAGKNDNQPERKNQNSPVETPTPTITPIFSVGKSSYTFAVISDIHSDYNALQKSLEKIKEDRVEFIVVVGDLTTVGNRNELTKVKQILDKNGVNYYAIPGNHDLWSVQGNVNPYEEVFGAVYQSFEKKGVKFILINNGDGIKGVDEKQSVWIKGQINNCPKITCLVFAHMPLNNSITNHIMGEGSPLVASQAANLIKEFNVFKIKELFAGHVHYLSNYTLDGLETNTDGAIYTNGGTQSPRFLEVDVTLPEVKIEKKEIWLTNEEKG